MPLHFPRNFVRSQGLFPSGPPINHSQRGSSPAAPALGRGNPQVAAVVSHLSQRERGAEDEDPARTSSEQTERQLGPQRLPRPAGLGPGAPFPGGAGRDRELGPPSHRRGKPQK